jgi:hypothetical protein
MVGDTEYTRGQTWGGLIKARLAYYLNHHVYTNQERAHYYAAAIQKLQYELGEKISSFPELDMTVAGFFSNNAEYMSGEWTGDELGILENYDRDNLNRLKKEERNRSNDNYDSYQS